MKGSNSLWLWMSGRPWLLGRWGQMDRLLVMSSGAIALSMLPSVPAVQAQITAADPTTAITALPGRFNIEGGHYSGNGSNVFHNFYNFGLNPSEVANFIVLSPGVQNILARVVGNNPSYINGLIQVSGSNANLYLMNPAGIVFGPDAHLNVQGSFTATTATGIGFGSAWFNAVGANTYTNLNGPPDTLAFTAAVTGSLVSAANLAVTSGQNISLIGGTVLATGQLTAPIGQVAIAAVPGNNLVRLSQVGNLLSLEFAPITRGTPGLPPAPLQPAPSLAQLLTGGSLPPVSGVTVDPLTDTVTLTSTNNSIAPGDVVGMGLNTSKLLIKAGRLAQLDQVQAGDVTVDLPGPALIGTLTTGSLQVNGAASILNTVTTVGDQTYEAETGFSNAAVFKTTAGTITFAQPLDGAEPGQTALNFQLGTGRLALTGDLGRNVPFKSVDISRNGPFVLRNSIFTQNGDVTIHAGQIDANPASSNPLQIATQGGNIVLNSDGGLHIQNVDLDTGVAGGRGGAIALTANNDILTGNLHTASDIAGGDIHITSQTSQITTGNLDATGGTQGGNIGLSAHTTIDTGTLNTASGSGPGGNVTLNALNDISVDWINAQGGSQGQGGTVDITAGQSFQAFDTFLDGQGLDASIATAGGRGGGDLTIRHGGGTLGEPFSIGNPNPNGTAGALTTGPNTVIRPGNAYRYSYTQDNIQLITSPAPAVSLPKSTVDARSLQEAPPMVGDVDSEARVDLDARVPMATLDMPGDDASVDAAFAHDFVHELGVDVQAMTSQAIRGLATTIATETGRHPAFVYINFVPAGDGINAPSPKAKAFAAPTGEPKAQDQPQRLAKQDTDQLELLIFTATGQPLRKLIPSATRQKVMQVARAFRSGVTDRTSDDYLEPAQQLYQWFIAPLESQLQARTIDNLLFLMDGGLRSLPIAALHDGKQFLVEKYSLGLAPSLSLVDTHYVNIQTAEVLAMGASQFANQKPLPAVPAELAMIARNFPHGFSLLNEAFTIENLKAKRSQAAYGIVHLATHGEFKPGNAGDSYIQFWHQRLMLNQIQQLKLNDPPVELLVLSACRTALGDDQTELGFAGLAAQAGVKAALASLWSVSDEGTLALMTEFYGQLRSPQVKIKVEALRQAQLAMLHGQITIAKGQLYAPSLLTPLQLPPELTDLDNDSLTHPYYWAAFTMIGNPW